MLLQIFRIWNIRRFFGGVVIFHCSLSSLRRDWKELSGQSQPAIFIKKEFEKMIVNEEY